MHHLHKEFMYTATLQLFISIFTVHIHIQHCCHTDRRDDCMEKFSQALHYDFF